MTTSSKVATLVASVLVLLAAIVTGAAAELQDCFRDGYVCSVKCDQLGFDKAESAICQAQCNAEEKVCLSRLSADRSPAPQRYTPNSNGVKARPVNAVQQSGYSR